MCNMRWYLVFICIGFFFGKLDYGEKYLGFKLNMILNKSERLIAVVYHFKDKTDFHAIVLKEF